MCYSSFQLMDKKEKNGCLFFFSDFSERQCFLLVESLPGDFKSPAPSYILMEECKTFQKHY